MIRKLSMFILIVLVIILFVKNLWNLDIAISKNNALTRQQQKAVEQMQSIDSIKQEAKTAIQQIREAHIKRSQTSSWSLFILGGILVASIIIYLTPSIKKI